MLTDLTVSVYKKNSTTHDSWVANEMQFIIICKYCSKVEGFVWGKSAGGDLLAGQNRYFSTTLKLLPRKLLGRLVPLDI